MKQLRDVHSGMSKQKKCSPNTLYFKVVVFLLKSYQRISNTQLSSVWGRGDQIYLGLFRNAKQQQIKVFKIALCIFPAFELVSRATGGRGVEAFPRYGSTVGGTVLFIQTHQLFYKVV